MEVVGQNKETMGSVPVSVFRIMTSDNAELAVSRIVGARPTGQAVILMHGNYAKRNFWISPKGIGLGAFLADSGFDVWIPELRGHGLSPKGPSFRSITAEDQIRFDLPAIQSFVVAQAGTPVSWVAHSSGGLYLMAALSAGWLESAYIHKIVLFGSQISKGEMYLKIPLLAEAIMAAIRLIGYFPAPRLGLGPEIESAGTMCEIIRWKKLGGKWKNSEGFDYWAGMRSVRKPILAFAGASDQNDPPSGCRRFIQQTGSDEKRLVVLGRRDGFSMNYDHVGMVVSRSSAKEVWPLVADWLMSRAGT